jgi:hypothetical protein
MFLALVTLLRRQGLRLRKGERDPPRRLMVTVLESDRDHNNAGRNTVEASLYEAYGTARMSGRGRNDRPRDRARTKGWASCLPALRSRPKPFDG